MKRPHFALPDIYGEPMSFYEILNKLGKLLNEETLDRKQSDDKLKHDIGTEASAREQADNALQEKINTNKNDISELKSDLANKLPKSPTNWGPWTADEQATAREKIGEPKYELMEEITLDGTEAQLIRDYTDNPCKKIMFKTEIQTTAVSMVLRYLLNDLYIIDSSNIGDSSYAYKHIARFELDNGLLTTLMLGNRGSDANRFYAETSIRGISYFLDRIDKVQLNIKNPVEGAKIYIYGVRA